MNAVLCADDVLNPLARGNRGAEPVTILFGSGGAAYREYVLSAIAPRYPLWLFAPQEPTWEQPYLVGHTVVDTLSVEPSIAAARALAAARPVSGVLCYDEVRVWQAASVAEALGLPTSSPSAVQGCRDKAISRQRMASAGVPQAQSECVADLAGAQRAAARIGYPVIVKPRALAGSEGVGLAQTPDQLAERFQLAGRAHFAEVPSYTEGILVEEFLAGPEISIDCVVHNGLVHPVFVGHKRLGLAPLFEETGHVVVANDRMLNDEAVRTVLQSAHDAIGFTHGITHSELRLTDTGPRVVEVNGRLGGDLIPYLGWLATGVDLSIALAQLANGQLPDVTPARTCASAIRFFYPPHDLRLESVDIDYAALPPGIWEVKALGQPGQEIRLPPAAHVLCRIAYAVALGADPDSCERALEGVDRAIRVTGDPLENALQ